MGELQQKYQQRLATMAASNNSKPELQFLLDACRQELAGELSNLQSPKSLILYILVCIISLKCSSI